MDDDEDFTVEDVLAGASDVVRRRRLLEVEDLDWLGMWAVLHSSDPLEGLEQTRPASGSVVRGRAGAGRR